MNNPISQKPVVTLKYKSSAEIQVCIIVTRQTAKCFCTKKSVYTHILGVGENPRYEWDWFGKYIRNHIIHGKTR